MRRTGQGSGDPRGPRGGRQLSTRQQVGIPTEYASGGSDGSGPSLRGWRTALVLCFVLGVLLIEVAWIVAVPPFRGIDEVDHAYRAAAVARGDFGPQRVPASDGRGGLVEVPDALVEAARPQCEALDYTSDETCRGTPAATPGVRLVATAASTQSPLLYFVTGTLSRPFEGAASLYVMRLTTSVITAGLMGLAAACLTMWARTRWPFIALAILMTPVVTYAAAVPAGNGPEMAAGILTWSALVGLAGAEVPKRHEKTLLSLATVGSVLLVSLRQLGPVLLLGIVLVTWLLAGRQRARSLISRHPRLMTTATILVIVSGALHLWWLLAAGYGTTEGGYGQFPPGRYLQFAFLYWLQSIATGAFRDQAAPGLVYVLVAVAQFLLIGAALRFSQRRIRTALLLTLAASVVGPALFTFVTHDALGPFWQGRYGIAFTAGVMVLAGLGLETSGRAPWRASWILALTAMNFATAVTAIGLYQSEMARSVSRGDPSWVAPTGIWAYALILGLICLAGGSLVTSYRRIPYE